MKTERGRRGAYYAPLHPDQYNQRETYFRFLKLMGDKAQELAGSAFLSWTAMDAAKKRGAKHIDFKNLDLHRERHIAKLLSICSNMDDLLEELDEEIELAGRDNGT